jgi:pyrroloquinoline quinone biosynthesis protein B
MMRLLGTAAGGGAPQWNCACLQCGLLRSLGQERLQECAAVSGDGRSWYLLNASPDIRTQLMRTPELAPGPGLRETPVKGVILTDAELDHTLGLFSLREAKTLDVYATAAVTRALRPVRRMIDPYGDGWRWHALAPGEALKLDGDLTVTPFALGDKRPRYASDVDGKSWVIGLSLVAEKTIVYAPCFETWSEALEAALQDADAAVIDGTFRTPDEMPWVRGHLSMAESLPRLSGYPRTAFRYTHLNNTNPVLTDPRDLPLAGEMELL